jgi:hypothetical protein
LIRTTATPTTTTDGQNETRRREEWSRRASFQWNVILAPGGRCRHHGALLPHRSVSELAIYHALRLFFARTLPVLPAPRLSCEM